MLTITLRLLVSDFLTENSLPNISSLAFLFKFRYMRVKTFDKTLLIKIRFY